MNYKVQTWDDQNKCVRNHPVPDAIDFEDAKYVVNQSHPEQKIISIIRRANV